MIPELAKKQIFSKRSQLPTERLFYFLPTKKLQKMIPVSQSKRKITKTIFRTLLNQKHGKLLQKEYKLSKINEIKKLKQIKSTMIFIEQNSQ